MPPRSTALLLCETSSYRKLHVAFTICTWSEFNITAHILAYRDMTRMNYPVCAWPPPVGLCDPPAICPDRAGVYCEGTAGPQHLTPQTNHTAVGKIPLEE